MVRLFKKSPSSRFRRPLVKPNATQYSHLVHFGKIDHGYYIIPCEHICETALVVPNVECAEPKNPPRNRDEEDRRKNYETMIAPLGDGYFVVKPKFEWGETFGQLIESFEETRTRDN